MGYEILKSITLEKIFTKLREDRESNPYCVVRQFIIIARQFPGIRDIIPLAFFEKHSVNYPEWIPWLIKYGFIKEKKEDKEGEIYTIGQQFVHTQYGEYILVQVGKNIINLISLKDGNRWSDALIEVKHPHKITEREMQQFPFWGKFTLK